MNKRLNSRTSCLFLGLGLLVISTNAILAQTTSFAYQGHLTDSGLPATGNYDLQFILFDNVAGGTQIGTPQTIPNTAVSAGIFTVQLNFGANAFSGTPRFLEISARLTGTPSFITLSPRQQITSTPYAIRSLNASSADAVMVGGLPSGSSNYIQNTTTQQASSNFNISGNGTVAGALTAGTIRAQTITGTYGLTHTDNNGANAITVGTYVGGSASGATGGWFGTLTPHSLHLFTGGGQASMTIDTTGNVGIGTTTTNIGKLNVVNNSFTQVAVFGNGGSNVGVYGIISGFGVRGESSGGGYGVYGSVAGNSGYGVYGESLGNGFGVFSVGFLGVTRLGTGGDEPLCLNFLGKTISTCGSSLRYKTDVQSFSGGLELVRRLRPVTYRWKADGRPDVGLIAEDVAELAPLFATRNDQGEIEGVKYQQLNVVLINAVNQQQAQIEKQQRQLQRQQRVIDELRKLVCQNNPQAQICKRSATK